MLRLDIQSRRSLWQCGNSKASQSANQYGNASICHSRHGSLNAATCLFVAVICYLIDKRRGSEKGQWPGG